MHIFILLLWTVLCEVWICVDSIKFLNKLVVYGFDVCTCMCVCARVCVHACMCVRVCFMHAYVLQNPELMEAWQNGTGLEIYEAYGQSETVRESLIVYFVC